MIPLARLACDAMLRAGVLAGPLGGFGGSIQDGVHSSDVELVGVMFFVGVPMDSEASRGCFEQLDYVVMVSLNFREHTFLFLKK
jgi:hypothetical protein